MRSSGSSGVGLARWRRWLRPAVRRPDRPRAGAPSDGRAGASRSSTTRAPRRSPPQASHRVERLDVMEAQHLGAGGEGERGRGQRGRPALLGGPGAHPTNRRRRLPGSPCARARRTVAARASGAPRGDAGISTVVGRRSKSRLQIERDLLGGDAAGDRASSRSANHLARWSTTSPYGCRSSTRGGPHVHQHVATAAFGDELEHRVLPAADVVDRHGPGVEGERRHVGRVRVGDHRRAMTPRVDFARSATVSTRRRRWRRRPAHWSEARRFVGRRKAAASGQGPTLSRSKPDSTSRRPSSIAALGRAASSAREERVGRDVDDPRRRAAGTEVDRAPRDSPAGHRSEGIRPMALSCVYTDLDGTLLGHAARCFATRTGTSRYARRARSRHATGPASRW